MKNVESTTKHKAEHSEEVGRKKSEQGIRLHQKIEIFLSIEFQVSNGLSHYCFISLIDPQLQLQAKNGNYATSSLSSVSWVLTHSIGIVGWKIRT